MKLNKLCEGKIFDNMYAWCDKNIPSFRELYRHEDIFLDDATKTIFAQELKIDTLDAILPYGITVEDDLEIVAPNLKSFKNLNKLDTIGVYFNGQSKLNFNKLQTADARNHGQLRFSFLNYTTLEADMFTKYIFDMLSFYDCKSNTLYDFSKYVRCDNISLYTMMLNADVNISNITYLLDPHVYIDEVDFSYHRRVGELLTKIVNKYLRYKDKENYVMDFTVEVLDNEFGENIL